MHFGNIFNELPTYVMILCLPKHVKVPCFINKDDLVFNIHDIISYCFFYIMLIIDIDITFNVLQ